MNHYPTPKPLTTPSNISNRMQPFPDLAARQLLASRTRNDRNPFCLVGSVSQKCLDNREFPTTGTKPHPSPAATVPQSFAIVVARHTLTPAVRTDRTTVM
jgi:hypothetical protein